VIGRGSLKKHVVTSLMFLHSAVCLRMTGHCNRAVEV
jgi:hypothetical protein